MEKFPGHSDSITGGEDPVDVLTSPRSVHSFPVEDNTQDPGKMTVDVKEKKQDKGKKVERKVSSHDSFMLHGIYYGIVGKSGNGFNLVIW